MLLVWNALITVTPLRALEIDSITFDRGQYRLYQKIEVTFRLNKDYLNPYDPAQIRVDATLVTPDSGQISVPCFYYEQAFYDQQQHDWVVDTTQRLWKVRYAAETGGQYQLSLTATDQEGQHTSQPVSFTVISEPESPGFVLQDTINPQYYRFSNGKPYYPVGYNVGWGSGQPDRIGTFVTHYSAMDANRANWSRFWLVAFGQSGLEWSANHWSGYYRGLGRYSQEAAALIDSVLTLAEEHGVYLQMVLQQHGQYSEYVNPTWDENPYNLVNGGYLNRAYEFFSDSLARIQTKKLYRYIVARWGYSSNVLAWELFNEANFTGSTDNPPDHDLNVADWHDEMSQYLKSVDPLGHLVTTSSDIQQLRLMDEQPAMDLLQYHLYQDPVVESLALRAAYMKSTLTKPVMNGEFGSNNAGDPYQNGLHPDQWGDHVRKGMWTGLFYDVPNMFWFWDSYIESKGLFQVFKPLGDFLEGEDLALANPTEVEPYLTGVPVVESSRKAIPGGDWGTVPETQQFVVSPEGTVEGIAQFPRYLQGTFHPELGTWIEFQVEFVRLGQATIEVADVAEAANLIEISVDDELVVSQAMEANSSLSVEVAAGNHTVRFSNGGQDWVNVKSYSFTGGNDQSVITLYSKSTHEGALGYFYDSRYGEWANPAEVDPVLTMSIGFVNYSPGIYQADFYDPIEGGILYTEYVNSLDSLLVLPVPVYRKDLALKLNFYGAGSLPVADAGGDQELDLGSSALLDGSNSFSPEGKPLFFSWELAHRPKGSQSVLFSDTLQEVEFMPDVAGTYLARLVVDDGTMVSTSDRALITVTSPVTGLEKLGNADQLKLYPNPASSHLNVLVPANETVLAYGIISSTGQTVTSVQESGKGSIEIDLVGLHLGPGVYILKVVTATAVFNKRFIYR